MSSAQMAFATYCFVCTVDRPIHAARNSGALMTVSLVISVLPLIGLGEYTYSGEGFCYADWTNTAHVFLMDLVLLPSTAVVLISYWLVVRAGAYNSSTLQLPRKLCFALTGGYFLLSWVLWYVGSIISFADSTYPKGSMITGAVLGHL